MIEIPFENLFILDDERKEVIIKALRLLLLVGEDHDCMIASQLLDLFLSKE